MRKKNLEKGKTNKNCGGIVKSYFHDLPNDEEIRQWGWGVALARTSSFLRCKHPKKRIHYGNLFLFELLVFTLSRSDFHFLYWYSRECLIEGTLRLSISIAKPYQNQGIDLEDLVQNGLVGGIEKAISMFNPHSAKFTTYVRWWMLQSCKRSIPKQGGILKIPCAIEEGRNKIRKAREQLRERGILHPSEMDLQKETGLNPQKLQEALIYEHLPRLSYSLSEPIVGSNEKDLFLENILYQEVSSFTHQRLLAIVNELPVEQEFIIKRWWGLEGQNKIDKITELQALYNRVFKTEVSAKHIKTLRDRAEEAISRYQKFIYGD